MNDKLTQFLDDAFKPYGNFPARKDVQQELLANLTEKYNDLKADGHSDEEAYKLTTASFGDVAEIMEHLAPAESPRASKKRGLKHTLITAITHPINGDPEASRFVATDLTDTDLAGTDLRGADFSMSALANVNFDTAAMHDTVFKAAALKGASFAGTDLAGAVFDSSDIQKVNFKGSNLTNTRLIRCALKEAQFTDAVLVNTEFKQSDLEKVSFDGLALTNVKFTQVGLKEATFNGAVLTDVSFHHTKVKHTNFDGAIMDKITYALLKGAKANLDNVTIQ